MTITRATLSAYGLLALGAIAVAAAVSALCFWPREVIVICFTTVFAFGVSELAAGIFHGEADRIGCGVSVSYGLGLILAICAQAGLFSPLPMQILAAVTFLAASALWTFWIRRDA